MDKKISNNRDELYNNNKEEICLCCALRIILYDFLILQTQHGHHGVRVVRKNYYEEKIFLVFI